MTNLIGKWKIAEMMSFNEEKGCVEWAKTEDLLARDPTDKDMNLIGRILQAVRGKASTLGADVWALLLLEDEETLKEFAKLCPEYVQVVGRLIVLRGHGNVWEGKATLYELRQLEGEVHKIIKLFEEEF